MFGNDFESLPQSLHQLPVVPYLDFCGTTLEYVDSLPQGTPRTRRGIPKRILGTFDVTNGMLDPFRGPEVNLLGDRNNFAPF